MGFSFVDRIGVKSPVGIIIIIIIIFYLDLFSFPYRKRFEVKYRADPLFYYILHYTVYVIFYFPEERSFALSSATSVSPKWSSGIQFPVAGSRIQKLLFFASI